MSTQEQLDRLSRLADFLDTLPPERFDFGTWASDADINQCGTTACALGWATTIPEFQALGLQLRPVEDPIIKCFVALESWVDDSNTFAASIAACGSVFGLTSKEAQYLFFPEYHLPFDASANQVAAHIRKFVASKAES